MRLWIPIIISGNVIHDRLKTGAKATTSSHISLPRIHRLTELWPSNSRSLWHTLMTRELELWNDLQYYSLAYFHSIFQSFSVKYPAFTNQVAHKKKTCLWIVSLNKIRSIDGRLCDWSTLLIYKNQFSKRQKSIDIIMEIPLAMVLFTMASGFTEIAYD